jgi:hypothetical protein
MGCFMAPRDALLLLILLMRCVLDLALEQVRQRAASGEQSLDPGVHLLGCAMLNLATYSSWAFLLPVPFCLASSAPQAPPADARMVSWEIRGYRLPAAPSWGRTIPIRSLCGGFLGACADQLQLRCFLALGAVHFRVLALGVVLVDIGFSSYRTLPGRALKLVLSTSLVASLLAFGFVVLPKDQAEPGSVGLLTVLSYWVLQGIVEQIRGSVFYVPSRGSCAANPSTLDSREGVAWFYGLAMGHLLFFFAESLEHGFYLCIQPPWFCLILWQGALWCLVVCQAPMIGFLGPISVPITSLGVSLAYPSVHSLSAVEAILGAQAVAVALFYAYFAPGHAHVFPETSKPCTHSDQDYISVQEASPTALVAAGPAGNLRARSSRQPRTVGMPAASRSTRAAADSNLSASRLQQPRTDEMPGASLSSQQGPQRIQPALKVGVPLRCALPMFGLVTMGWWHNGCLKFLPNKGLSGLLLGFPVGAAMLVLLLWRWRQKDLDAAASATIRNNRHAFATCAVCADKEADHVAVPCGHMSQCAACVELLLKQRRLIGDSAGQHLPPCIMCRKPVREFVRVFVT